MPKFVCVRDHLTTRQQPMPNGGMLTVTKRRKVGDEFIGKEAPSKWFDRVGGDTRNAKPEELIRKRLEEFGVNPPDDTPLDMLERLLAEANIRESLREEAEQLGVKVDMRWGTKTLTAEIKKARKLRDEADKAKVVKEATA